MKKIRETHPATTKTRQIYHRHRTRRGEYGKIQTIVLQRHSTADGLLYSSRLKNTERDRDICLQ